MRTRFIILTMVVLITLSGSLVYCQSETESALKEAAVNLRTAALQSDFKLNMETHAMLERCLSIEPENAMIKYFIAYSEYRLYMSKQAGVTVPVDKYYDTAVEICKALIAKKQLVSETKTILASLYMMRIADNPMEAMGLAPQIMSMLEEAIQEDITNPRPLITKGVMLLNMPPMFGGSIEKAYECFDAAVKLYDKQKKDALINWGSEECRAWMGQALEKLNQKEKAREVYMQLLKEEPEFKWVKYLLLPALDKKQ